MRSSEAYPRVGPVVELQTRSTGGLRRRTGCTPLPHAIRKGWPRAFLYLCGTNTHL